MTHGVCVRLWEIYDGVHADLLHAENTHIKAYIDENEVKKMSQFAEWLCVAEEQMLEWHLEKQKQLWHTSLVELHRNLESNKRFWLSKKAFHTCPYFFLIPLCYTIISICYYITAFPGNNYYLNCNEILIYMLHLNITKYLIIPICYIMKFPFLDGLKIPLIVHRINQRLSHISHHYFL